MNYNVRLETPNFEQAIFYAKELQEDGFANDDVRLDTAEVLVQFGWLIPLIQVTHYPLSPRPSGLAVATDAQLHGC